MEQLSVPRPIGFFSIDKDQSIRFDKSNASFLYEKPFTEPRVNINLNPGYEEFVDWNCPSIVGFHGICRWVMHQAPPRSSVNEALRGAEFLCSRGILKKIAATPYNQKNSWELVAMKKDGVIFISERLGSSRSTSPKGSYESKATYWGQKFEQCMQTNSKQGVPQTKGTVRGGYEYRAVVATTISSKTRTNPVRIVVCGEVDCLEHDGSFVELKTHANSIDEKFWRNKSRDTYIQCRLLRVPHVVIGLRNNAGYVRQVIKMPVETLRRGGDSYWSFDVCMSYLHSILDSVRCNLSENQACVFSKSSDSMNVRRSLPVRWTELDILPNDFKNHFGIH